MDRGLQVFSKRNAIRFCRCPFLFCLFDGNESTNYWRIGHDSTVHFGDLGSKDSVQTILRKQLPMRCLAFVDDETVVGGGYDNVPVLYRHSGGRWEEVGPLDTGKTKKKPVVKASAFGSAFNKWER